jgi:hypothetical protein
MVGLPLELRWLRYVRLPGFFRIAEGEREPDNRADTPQHVYQRLAPV